VSQYLLDNAAAEAAERFAALSALYDPVTARHVDALGVPAGGSCWEVGAGGPSVPGLLAERVGPRGRVVATDLDVTWLADASAGVEVRRHDVAADEAPGEGFDLVHARLVLVHVPARDDALRSMVGALRPGGWLLVEDFDTDLQPLACLDAAGAAGRRANGVREGLLALLAARGVDPRFGRSLPRRLRAAGLVDVGADAYLPVADPAVARLEIANVRQVRDGLVATGTVTATDVDAHLEAVARGDLDLTTPPLVSAWGRQPLRE
jgi:ubiquinone/menaquinone biosynthesis C-methylase UbiE